MVSLKKRSSFSFPLIHLYVGVFYLHAVFVYSAIFLISAMFFPFLFTVSLMCFSYCILGRLLGFFLSSLTSNIYLGYLSGFVCIKCSWSFSSSSITGVVLLSNSWFVSSLPNYIPKLFNYRCSYIRSKFSNHRTKFRFISNVFG